MNLLFEKYKDVLQFVVELPLTAEPLRIDLLIKKLMNVVIDKNVAYIFRGYNVFEYKGPSGYISKNNFDKIYGCACLYGYLNKIDRNDITISFVTTRYPRNLIEYLIDNFGYTVEEKWSGIYIITGDIMPIQIIMSNKLSAEDNLWLKGLNKNLDFEIINKIILESGDKDDSYTKAFWDAIMRANDPIIEEAIKMGAPALEDIFERTGLTAKWEARGEAKGIEIGEARGEMRVLSLMEQGYSLDEIKAKLKPQ